MPKGVRCKVEECVFHDEGDGCTAQSIEVRTNGNDIVGTPRGTMCATFQFHHVRGAQRDPVHSS
ncbi:MAG: DUF1540 domain-containing protein [Alicyclobacillus sp.]|nr:DUF1540 domain-containing protein [Alicyclobacillus sp.]